MTTAIRHVWQPDRLDPSPDADRSHAHFHSHGEQHVHRHVHDGSEAMFHAHSTLDHPPERPALTGRSHNP